MSLDACCQCGKTCIRHTKFNILNSKFFLYLVFGNFSALATAYVDLRFSLPKHWYFESVCMHQNTYRIRNTVQYFRIWQILYYKHLQRLPRKRKIYVICCADFKFKISDMKRNYNSLIKKLDSIKLDLKMMIQQLLNTLLT